MKATRADPLIPGRGIGGGSDPEAVNGTTSDYIEVSFVNGEMVDVTSVDNYAPTANTPMRSITGEINSKLKDQANTVVVYVSSVQVFDNLNSVVRMNPNVRILYPDEGIDTGANQEQLRTRILNAASGLWNAEAQLQAETSGASSGGCGQPTASVCMNGIRLPDYEGYP